jgi:phosphate transport system substrate-binding protein
MPVFRFLPLFSLVLVLCLLSPPAPHAEDDPPPGETVLRIAGTGDSQTLLRLLADSFQRDTPGLRVDIPDSIGSSGGMKALAAGQTDLARIARPLTETEIRSGFVPFIFAISPVVFVTQKKLPEDASIGADQVVSIYQGTLRDWRELGAPPGEIYPIGRENGDSSLSVLQEKFPALARPFAPPVKIAYTTGKALAALTGYDNTFGFLPLSSIRGSGLRPLALDGVAPSPETVANGRYPLTTPFLVVSKGEPKGLASTFIGFLFSEPARKILLDSGALPAKAP